MKNIIPLTAIACAISCGCSVSNTNTQPAEADSTAVTAAEEAAAPAATATPKDNNVAVTRLSAGQKRTIRVEDPWDEGQMTDAEISIAVAYDLPTDADSNPALFDRIVTYISQGTGLPVKTLKNQDLLDWGVEQECKGETEGVERHTEVYKIFEDDQYITYETTRVEEPYGVGAEVVAASTSGATFRKRDGHQITWSDIRKTDALLKTIARELVGPDADLSQMRYPETTPYLTDGGWRFIYQYELETFGVLAGDQTDIKDVQLVD